MKSSTNIGITDITDNYTDTMYRYRFDQMCIEIDSEHNIGIGFKQIYWYTGIYQSQTDIYQFQTVLSVSKRYIGIKQICW